MSFYLKKTWPLMDGHLLDLGAEGVLGLVRITRPLETRAFRLEEAFVTAARPARGG